MLKWFSQNSADMDMGIWVRCRLLPCLLLAALLNSCGSDNSKETKAPAPEKPKYEVHTVEIKDMKFVPDSLVVKKGDEVVFVNRDMVNHCVTEVNKAWTSGMLPQGESYLLVADSNANYYCAIHTVMKGKIIVQ